MIHASSFSKTTSLVVCKQYRHQHTESTLTWQQQGVLFCSSLATAEWICCCTCHISQLNSHGHWNFNLSQLVQTFHLHHCSCLFFLNALIENMITINTNDLSSSIDMSTHFQSTYSIIPACRCSVTLMAKVSTTTESVCLSMEKLNPEQSIHYLNSVTSTEMY